MAPDPIRKLVQDLDHVLRGDPQNDPARAAEVAERLGGYAREHDDWREFACFSEGTYARNLVHVSPLYELIVICWDVDQVSPIHDHDGSRCWMGVLEGRIQESLFRLDPEGGPLIEGKSQVFGPGQVAYIHDEIAVHEIRSVGGVQGISLHLYSRPIKTCRVFDRDSGRVERRELGYHSVQGVVGAEVR